MCVTMKRNSLNAPHYYCEHRKAKTIRLRFNGLHVCKLMHAVGISIDSHLAAQYRLHSICERIVIYSLGIRLAIGRSAVHIHYLYPLAMRTGCVALSTELLLVMFANRYSLPAELFSNYSLKNCPEILRRQNKR